MVHACMLVIDNFLLADINECLLGTDLCSQTCSNTVGSYTCGCNTGYTLNSDGQMCDGKAQRIKPCTYFIFCRTVLQISMSAYQVVPIPVSTPVSTFLGLTHAHAILDIG